MRMPISDGPITVDDITRLYGFDIVNDALTDYPIWDEGRREWLNERILDHFRFREVAQETPQLFAYFLKRQMHESMPMVNPLFKALNDVDILEGYSTTTATEGKQDGKQLFSATPQTQLSGHKNYATNITESEGTGSNVTKASGRNQSVAALATDWASGINNALDMVFSSLEPLFIQVWN